MLSLLVLEILLFLSHLKSYFSSERYRDFTVCCYLSLPYSVYLCSSSGSNSDFVPWEKVVSTNVRTCRYMEQPENAPLVDTLIILVDGTALVHSKKSGTFRTFNEYAYDLI